MANPYSEIEKKYKLNLGYRETFTKTASGGYTTRFSVSWIVNHYREKAKAEKRETQKVMLSFGSGNGAIQNVINLINFGTQLLNFATSKRSDEINKIQSQTNKLNRELEDKSSILTQVLMKNPFAIMANGSLYKKGRPGSKSYDPLTPWEPYKYITGDIKPDEFNDILMGRSHLKLAGNRDYYSNVWAEPEWQTPDRDALNRQLDLIESIRFRQIKKGYEELNDLGWYQPFYANNNNPGIERQFGSPFIDEGIPDLNELYRQDIKRSTHPRFKPSRYSTGD